MKFDIFRGGEGVRGSSEQIFYILQFSQILFQFVLIKSPCHSRTNVKCKDEK